MRTSGSCRCLNPALEELRPAARSLPGALGALRRFVPAGRGLVRDLQPLVRDGRAPAASLSRALRALGPTADGLREPVANLRPIVGEIDRNKDGIGKLGERFSGVFSTNDVNGPILRGLGFFEPFNPANVGAPGATGAELRSLKLKSVRALVKACRNNGAACLARHLVPGAAGRAAQRRGPARQAGAQAEGQDAVKLHISRPWAIALVVFLLTSGALFLTLTSRFGGPSLIEASTYELTATFPDTQGLAKKSDVLVRGVKVGEVGAIDVDDGLAHVRLDIQPRYAPVDRSAKVRVAQKTVLGEAYVDLIPARRTTAPLEEGSQLPRANVLASVELDEALGALDRPARRNLTSMLDTLSRGAADPATTDRVNATLGEIDTLTGALRRLTATLKGQEGTISATVQDARIVLRELGRREEQVTRIVSNGRATLEAMSGRQQALDAGLRELPRLLVSARATLAEARPLLREAKPLVDDLRRAAPDLTPAIADLRPVARDATSVVRGLPRLSRTAVPVLRRADTVVKAARPVARALSPTLANLVPAARYLEPRRRSLAAWFSQTAGLGRQGDAKGRWARFFIFIDPQTAGGTPGPRQGNSYTPPEDALDNQPHKPGSYSRLVPFKP